MQQRNPNFQPPEAVVRLQRRDTADATAYWNHHKFYYPMRKQIVQACSRANNASNSTTLGFVALYDEESGTRLINKDFWYWANKQEIKRFKSNIVDPIREKLGLR